MHIMPTVQWRHCVLWEVFLERRGTAQWVECLPTAHKSLGLIHSIAINWVWWCISMISVLIGASARRIRSSKSFLFTYQGESWYGLHETLSQQQCSRWWRCEGDGHHHTRNNGEDILREEVRAGKTNYHKAHWTRPGDCAFTRGQIEMENGNR